MNDEEVIDVLVGLGLSLLEAKIYLALLKLEGKPATVKVISHIAEVVRQDTYRVLSVLHNRGVVEKILNNPTMYKCLPLESGISKLLNQKTEQYLEVKKKSELMIKTYKTKSENRKEEYLHFSLIANTDLLVQKLKKEIAKTKWTIEMIYARERMSVLAFHLLEDLKKALDRGVRISIVATSVAGGQFEKNLRNLQKANEVYENLDVRYIKKTPDIGLTIFDKNKCYIRTAPSLGNSLFTINDNITSLAAFYFNNIWEKSLLGDQISQFS